MHGIKSSEGRWSVSLCNCVLHISLDDLRALGSALQSVADSVEQLETEAKKGSRH